MSQETRRIQIILELTKAWGATAASGLVASIGLSALDDCAVIPFGEELDLVVGSDFVRGEDFFLYRLGHLGKEDIGYYLVGANVSDLAAMGATPVGILVAFRYCPEMTDDDFRAIMTGVCMACVEFSIPLLGGDTGSYPASVLTATALGVCPHGRALLRSGGRDGDVLFISGDVGAAGAALSYFNDLNPEERVLPESEEEELLRAWRRVSPAIAHGRLLIEHDLSRCGIDTSDGLKVACEQLAAACGLDVIVDADLIPIAPAAKRVAALLATEPLTLALGASVDFRLLFTVKAESASRVKELFARHELSLFELGALAKPSTVPSALLKTSAGLVPLPGIGWLQ